MIRYDKELIGEWWTVNNRMQDDDNDDDCHDGSRQKDLDQDSIETQFDTIVNC